MPFQAERSTWPCALSKAPAFGVHRSEAETLDQKERAVLAKVFSRKGGGINRRRYLLGIVVKSNFKVRGTPCTLPPQTA
jgi:hypothetical protein